MGLTVLFSINQKLSSVYYKQCKQPRSKGVLPFEMAAFFFLWSTFLSIQDDGNYRSRVLLFGWI